MADYYMILHEDDNGMIADDPQIFDTEDEAKRYAAQHASLPSGHDLVLYKCYGGWVLTVGDREMQDALNDRALANMR